MVELQPPNSVTNPDEFTENENAYQAFARRRLLVDKDGEFYDDSNPLHSSIVQNVRADANNSSILNLTSVNSFTFTGVAYE